MNNPNSSNEHLQRELHELRSRVEYLEQQEAGHIKSLESLRIRDAQFRHFFEQSTDSKYISSPNGLILDINAAALGYLGYTPEELIGKPVLSLYAPETHLRINQLSMIWMQNGEINNEEVEIITKQGIRYSVQINGIDKVVITKLDVLDGLKTIRICTAYKYKGELHVNIPGDPNFLNKCEPVYEEHPGWLTDTSKVTSYKELPKNARKYLDRIKELIETDIMLVSVGKSRKQTLIYG